MPIQFHHTYAYTISSHLCLYNFITPMPVQFHHTYACTISSHHIYNFITPQEASQEAQARRDASKAKYGELSSMLDDVRVQAEAEVCVFGCVYIIYVCIMYFEGRGSAVCVSCNAVHDDVFGIFVFLLLFLCGFVHNCMWSCIHLLV